MAIFSGNIIEAYYANSDNDTIEVIYKQGEKAINHFLRVDYKNQDFKDLITFILFLINIEIIIIISIISS